MTEVAPNWIAQLGDDRRLRSRRVQNDPLPLGNSAPDRDPQPSAGLNAALGDAFCTAGQSNNGIDSCREQSKASVAKAAPKQAKKAPPVLPPHLRTAAPQTPMPKHGALFQTSQELTPPPLKGPPLKPVAVPTSLMDPLGPHSVSSQDVAPQPLPCSQEKGGWMATLSDGRQLRNRQKKPVSCIDPMDAKQCNDLPSSSSHSPGTKSEHSPQLQEQMPPGSTTERLLSRQLESSPRSAPENNKEEQLLEKLLNSSVTPSPGNRWHRVSDRSQVHGCQVIATTRFVAQERDHLSLEVGDRLVLTGIYENGFYPGKHLTTGKCGWLPASAVEQVDATEQAERKESLASQASSCMVFDMAADDQEENTSEEDENDCAYDSFDIEEAEDRPAVSAPDVEDPSTVQDSLGFFNSLIHSVSVDSMSEALCSLDPKQRYRLDEAFTSAISKENLQLDTRDDSLLENNSREESAPSVDPTSTEIERGRPETTPVVARRLVHSHLEVPLNAEHRAQEREFWNGSSGSPSKTRAETSQQKEEETLLGLPTPSRCPDEGEEQIADATGIPGEGLLVDAVLKEELEAHFGQTEELAHSNVENKCSKDSVAEIDEKELQNAGSVAGEYLRGETLDRYQCPDTLRTWFYNEANGKSFFWDATWAQYQYDTGKYWWCRESTEEWFYERHTQNS